MQKFFKNFCPHLIFHTFFGFGNQIFKNSPKIFSCAMLSTEMPSTSQHVLPRLFSRKRGSYMKRYFHSPHILPAGRLLSQKSHNLRLKSWPAGQCWILLRPLLGVSLVRISAESWRPGSAARSTGLFSASLYSVVNEEKSPHLIFHTFFRFVRKKLRNNYVNFLWMESLVISIGFIHSYK